MNEEELKELNEIKERYEIKEETDLEKIKRLDRKAKRPAYIFAYTYGIISVLIMGTGMCYALEALGSKDWMKYMGYAIGTVGIILCCLTYPIFKKILNKGINKYKDEILNLTNKAIGE